MNKSTGSKPEHRRETPGKWVAHKGAILQRSGLGRTGMPSAFRVRAVCTFRSAIAGCARPPSVLASFWRTAACFLIVSVHRRLRGLLSQRSSVPQGNGGALYCPRASRISSIGTQDASATFSFHSSVRRFQRIVLRGHASWASTGLPISLNEDVLQAEFDAVDPQMDGT